MRDLVSLFEERADNAERVGAMNAAYIWRKAAEDARDWFYRHDHEELTIREAAEESGYTEDYLRDLVRSGRLPDSRPEGSQGRILIRRCDLPRKLPAEGPAPAVLEIAEALHR